jgi:Protein of unknown function (DUF4012)
MKNSLDAPEYEPYEPEEFDSIEPNDESAENDETIEVVPAQRVWPLEIPQEWRDRLALWQARVAEEMRSLHSRALVPLGWESEATTQPNLPVLRSLTPQRPDGRQKLLLVSSLVVVAAMFVSLLLPGMGILSAYKEYSDLRALGESGLHHLLAVKDDFAGLASLMGASSGSTGASSSTSKNATSKTAATNAASGGLGSALDPKALKNAQAELKAAQQDFNELRGRLSAPDWILVTAGSIPGLDSKIASVRALADVGVDVSTIGVESLGAVMPLIDRLTTKSASLGDSELLTKTDLDHIKSAATHAMDLLQDVQVKLAGVNLNDLPISASQKTELAKVMVELPRVRSLIGQVVPYIDPVGWLLGVGQPRHFLVQTLDRAELRPSGGFAGNYGVLTLTNGKLEPFSLYNVNDIDYGLKTNGWIFGKRPPAQYSWWPFANWGLRDANLSPDFPTTAKIITDVFRNEGGGDVDGLIQISPVAIEHVLNVTGPIYVPDYNETVTAQNLEDKIHFYQQDPRGIAIEQRLNPNDKTHSLRKRFTQLVVQLLQDKVKKLPLSQMSPLAKQFLKDLQAKDIQINVNNETIQKTLDQLHATGAIDTTAGLDGYFLSQANTSVAKLTPYVQMTQTDDVTLDDSGGATHHLVITFHNNPTGPIYGYPTYRDYVRIYVPEQAQLKDANGFDTGVPLCWAPGPGATANPDGTYTVPARFANVPYCPAVPYTAHALTCPPGQYAPGTMASSVFGSDGKTSWALDRVGAPTATVTDVPGRAMWGGYVVVPRYCTATVTLDYYVPNVVAPSSSVPSAAAPYSMLLQRQGGTFYDVTVNMHPSPKMAASGMHDMTYKATISDSTGFTFGKPGAVTLSQMFGFGSLTDLMNQFLK